MLHPTTTTMRGFPTYWVAFLCPFCREDTEAQGVRQT